MTLVLKGARCVDPQVNLDSVCDILVEGTQIIAIDNSIDAPQNASVLDCSGKVILPGLMDIHVHFRDPGQEYKETIEGGCASSAHGGYTDVATMPNTSPVCDTGALVTYQIEKSRACGTARIHPIGAISHGQQQESLAEIGDMYAAGARAFSDDGRGVQTAGLMRIAMDYISQFDAVAISHCQDEFLVGSGVVNEGVVSTRLGLAGWPAQGEEIQIARDIMLSELTGCPLHIAHVSTIKGVEMVKQAKQSGLQVTCEVTPHHLFLCEDDITEDFDTNYKMNPPLRTKEDMLALQEALIDGTIDCVVSDHAPHAAHEKDYEFERAPFGIVGIETELPLILTNLVQNGKLSWSRVVQTMCINPRKILRCNPVVLKPGSEATLVVIDPQKKFTVTKDWLVSKSKNTPFLGFELTGCATDALLCGSWTLRSGSVAIQS
ncbi:MAG: dihydroorotase [Coriobacteriales bacterium]|nr:dihydroorotase [Coriobacteriales bacterium]